MKTLRFLTVMSLALAMVFLMAFSASAEVTEVPPNIGSILITDMKYLCSEDFDENHARFTNLIDTVVFVDALTTVNAFARQMSLFHASIKNVRDINALRAKNSSKKHKGGGAADGFRLRYTSKQIKYVCFDDSRTPGLDKVLKNLLSADFVSSDAMTYAPETIICCYNCSNKFFQKCS